VLLHVSSRLILREKCRGGHPVKLLQIHSHPALCYTKGCNSEQSTGRDWRMNEKIQSVLNSLPHKPGIYIMKDANGAILYVGKAKSLYNRVRSYFLKAATLEPHKRQMVTEIADIQYLLAETPTQALHFEADLVRHERPRYNVKLRDDKHYPYIRINVHEPWPKAMVARRMQRDGARYFGPFTDATSVRQTLDTINRLFPHILCNRVITGKDPRACLYYHIKRCPAPCIGAINNDDYRQIVDQMVGFLDGKSDSVLADMRHEMERAADVLEFERAADLRDRIRAAERVITQQEIVYSSIDDEDVIGVHHEGPYSAVQVFLVRGGRLIGREHFVLEGHGDDSDAEIVWSFVVQYYSQTSDIPDEVVLPLAVDDVDSVRVWLTDRRAETGSKRKKKVRVTSPRVGDKRHVGARGAADLLGENIDVDERLSWRDQLEAPRRDFAELAANHDQRIGSCNQIVCDAGITSEQSGGKRMRAGNRTLAGHRVRKRNAEAFREREQRVVPCRDMDATADEQ